MSKYLEGNIMSGRGEGKRFMAMEHYRNEIKNNVGFYAYPGTLNVRIEKQEPLENGIRIGGFKSGEKNFGGATCHKCSIKDIDCAIILPDLTRHGKDIIEIIAPMHLRTELKLKDGDKINIFLK